MLYLLSCWFQFPFMCKCLRDASESQGQSSNNRRGAHLWPFNVCKKIKAACKQPKIDTTAAKFRFWWKDWSRSDEWGKCSAEVHICHPEWPLWSVCHLQITINPVCQGMIHACVQLRVILWVNLLLVYNWYLYIYVYQIKIKEFEVWIKHLRLYWSGLFHGA